MSYKEICFDEAKKIIDGGGIIVDTREETEFVQGHADGAELLPVDDITEESAAWVIPDKDTPIITYCRTGARAILAAERLVELGYTNVYTIGSIVGWEYGIVHGL